MVSGGTGAGRKLQERGDMEKIRIGHRDHPKHLVDAWSVCETLRRFGFRPEEMAVGYGPVSGVGEDVLFVTLSTDDTEFVTAAATVEGGPRTEEEALGGWAELWEDVMHATDEQLAVALSKSVSGEYARVVRLAAELAARSIRMPFLNPEEASPLVLVIPQAVVMTKGGDA